MSPDTAYLISVSMVFLMKIVCFLFGYLTIRIGYQLLASGIKGEFKFSATLAGVKADLVSVSPGLLFVLLGSLLIGYTLFVNKEIKLLKNNLNPVEQFTPAIPSENTLGEMRNDVQRDIKK